LPPQVSVGLDDRVRDYWLYRARQALVDSYAGVAMMKFPEDLRTYEHLLWASEAKVVVEVGTNLGGSALWFRDRLAAFASYGRIDEPRVISIDIDQSRARAALSTADPDYERSIRLVEADATDARLPELVEAALPPGSRCFVVEDSAHTYPTTFGALQALARFVPVGGFFVVEDGCVDIDEMRADRNWPRGVLPAVEDWLASEEGRRFVRRRDLELYGISCHPYGFLQRAR
jgi:cephalosporin hydroxylase